MVIIDHRPDFHLGEDILKDSITHTVQIDEPSTVPGDILYVTGVNSDGVPIVKKSDGTAAKNVRYIVMRATNVLNELSSVLYQGRTKAKASDTFAVGGYLKFIANGEVASASAATIAAIVLVKAWAIDPALTAGDSGFIEFDGSKN